MSLWWLDPNHPCCFPLFLYRWELFKYSLTVRSTCMLYLEGPKKLSTILNWFQTWDYVYYSRFSEIFVKKKTVLVYCIKERTKRGAMCFMEGSRVGKGLCLWGKLYSKTLKKNYRTCTHHKPRWKWSKTLKWLNKLK